MNKKFYFSIDTDWISKYIDSINNQLINTLGLNAYQEQISIPKYFVKQELDIELCNHLKSNAVHVIKQPHYYRNMFTILN